MAAILNAVLRVLSIVGEILGIVQTVQAGQSLLATEATVDRIDGNVKDIQLKINDSVIGLAALQAQIATFQATTALDFTALSTQISAFSPGGSTVQIGMIDIGGISPAMLEVVAEYVWNFDGPTTAHNAIDLLEDAAVPNIAFDNWQTTLPFHNLAGWEFRGLTNIDDASPAGSELLPLDFSTVAAGDATAVDWLNRVWGDTHFVDAGGGAPGFTDDNSNFMWVPWLQQPLFEILRDRALGVSGATGAPVWPGIAGVTLGTSVPIDTGVTVVGPMQGVLIALTSVPAEKSFFTFDTDNSYRNIGALTFQSDNGDDEPDRKSVV